jgi:DNA polymerase-3 subunit alpha
VAAALRVHVSTHSTEIEALKKRLTPAATERGGGEVMLVASLGGGREVELKLPGRFTLDASLRGALKTAPGVSYLEDA